MMNADRMIPKKAWHDKKVQLVSHVDNHHHHQQQQHHHHHRHLSPTSSIRRPRADTMPSQSTAFPYLSTDPATIAALSKTSAAKDVLPTRSVATTSKQVVPPSSSSAASLRTRSGSVTLPPSLANPFGEGIFSNNWGREHVQSPTTPTTDQLLEGEGNTIASTLAQLGLDDERDKRHTIHTRHSYSSLRSVANWHHPQRHSGHEGVMDTPWRQSAATTTSQAPPISESMMPFPAVAESPNIDPSLIMAKFQSQTGRPRAISMSVAGSCYAHPHQPTANSSTDDLSRNLLSPSYRSIWHPPLRHRYQHNPSRLRTSNSSADLLELMARQRTSLVTDDAHDDWDAIPFGGSSSQSSNYDFASVGEGDMDQIISSGKNSPGAATQAPTRSLWLGNIDPSLTTQDLNCIFSPFGAIESVRILPDRECAFVNFTSLEDALRAKDELVHKMNSRLGNTPVKVGFGKPEPPTCGDIGANAQQEPTRALWIGNIPATTTYSTLLSIFSPFGAIESVRVLTHKNCGFVNFESLEDAVRAKKALQNTEIMGPNTGAVRIGFAKVPVKTAAGGYTTTLEDVAGNNVDGEATKMGWAALNTNNNSPEEYQQMMMYMMAEMMGPGSTNLYAAVARERQVIMQQLGDTADDENDGPAFDELHLPLSYFPTIPPAPELGQTRKIDIARLRDIRKRLDTGYISVQELELIAVECVDEIVELCSDYIGNTVIQRLFERCSETTRSRMIEVVAPYLASIGIHKNGTWAAQKIIDTGRLPEQIDRICESLLPYVPALLLDQFGNYVVQCCLGLGPERNQFIFDAIVDNCWEIAQGRFGARAVRATLESPHVTKRQQRYIAATIVQHASVLATNANGALLLIWLLDTSGIPGRYRVLAPRLVHDKRNLTRLCTHKLASLTVLKIINQRQEPDARALILDALIFSTSDPVIDDVLMDQVHGVNLVQKILSSSYVDLRERQRIAERVKQILNKLKLQHVQGYKRLMEEINMVMGDSNPGASLGALPGLVPPSFAMNPEIAAALHAKYLAAMAASTNTSTNANTRRESDEKQSGSDNKSFM
ncbi:hypothetical protein LRAMOSA01568 [Lichtheimia ramosa]|uniref:PUM-HD domain-containing protein n=1 Tax=Lichtheimia ramosa TaxID=688394 RepID=A0A077WKJ0_9FUNG|nr:hypothetical protein LRAMOSA01568 [Lichtheimia ramosa]